MHFTLIQRFPCSPFPLDGNRATDLYSVLRVRLTSSFFHEWLNFSPAGMKHA